MSRVLVDRSGRTPDLAHERVRERRRTRRAAKTYASGQRPVGNQLHIADEGAMEAATSMRMSGRSSPSAGSAPDDAGRVRGRAARPDGRSLVT